MRSADRVPMVAVVEDSSIFAHCSYETIRVSETAASFVDWQRPPIGKQHYRPPRKKSSSEDNSLAVELRSLASKVDALQQVISGAPAPAAPPKTSARPSKKKDYFESCAEYAGEASRVRAAGRLAFSSDFVRPVPPRAHPRAPRLLCRAPTRLSPDHRILAGLLPALQTKIR